MERRAQALFKSKKLESNNFYNCTILLTVTLWIKFLLFPWKWAFSIVLMWPEKCKNVIYKHNYQLFTLKMLFKMTTLSKICSKFPYSSGSDRNFPCSSVDLIVQIINLCVRVVGMQGELGRGGIAWESWDEKYKDWKANKKTNRYHNTSSCIHVKQRDLRSWRGSIAWEKMMQKYKDKKTNTNNARHASRPCMLI